LVYHNRAVVYEKKGQYDQAISDYTKALEIDPNLADAYHNRGVVYGRENQPDQAISDFTEAIKR
jgi:tetratricopeptide (TPR) repeat protein